MHNMIYKKNAKSDRELQSSRKPTNKGQSVQQAPNTAYPIFKDQGVPPWLRLSSHPQEDSQPEPLQREPNVTGLPDDLKSGVEYLSGISLDDVHVHYNSSQPAQMQAFAYTQGTDIQIAPDQERYLSHEAWHVVQQKQGRVAPTRQMAGIQINDDINLENEANIMGNQALSSREYMRPASKQLAYTNSSTEAPLQGMFWEATNTGEYQRHEEDPTDDFVNTGMTYQDGALYFRKDSLRGKLKIALENCDFIEGDAEGNQDKSCFNFALTGFAGFTAQAPSPEHVYGYVNATKLNREVGKRAKKDSMEQNSIDKVSENEGKAWLIANKNSLDAISKELEKVQEKEQEQILSAKKRKKIEGASPRKVITSELTEKIIQANGFEIVDYNTTPYAICMHYKKKNAPTFDHWWITIDGKVVETFPGKVKDINILKEEQEHVDNEGNPMDVIRIGVRNLKQVQIDHIIKAIQEGTPYVYPETDEDEEVSTLDNPTT